jgi:hypothetical protein
MRRRYNKSFAAGALEVEVTPENLFNTEPRRKRFCMLIVWVELTGVGFAEQACQTIVGRSNASAIMIH